MIARRHARLNDLLSQRVKHNFFPDVSFLSAAHNRKINTFGGPSTWVDGGRFPDGMTTISSPAIGSVIFRQQQSKEYTTSSRLGKVTARGFRFIRL